MLMLLPLLSYYIYVHAPQLIVDVLWPWKVLSFVPRDDGSTRDFNHWCSHELGMREFLLLPPLQTQPQDGIAHPFEVHVDPQGMGKHRWYYQDAGTPSCIMAGQLGSPAMAFLHAPKSPSINRERDQVPSHACVMGDLAWEEPGIFDTKNCQWPYSSPGHVMGQLAGSLQAVWSLLTC